MILIVGRSMDGSLVTDQELGLRIVQHACKQSRKACLQKQVRYGTVPPTMRNHSVEQVLFFCEASFRGPQGSR